MSENRNYYLISLSMKVNKSGTMQAKQGWSWMTWWIYQREKEAETSKIPFGPIQIQIIGQWALRITTEASMTGKVYGRKV